MIDWSEGTNYKKIWALTWQKQVSSPGRNTFGMFKALKGQIWSGWCEMSEGDSKKDWKRKAGPRLCRSLDFILSVMGSYWRILNREITWSDMVAKWRMDCRGQEHYQLGGYCSGPAERWAWLRPLLCRRQQRGVERSRWILYLGDGVDRICWWIGCIACTR